MRKTLDMHLENGARVIGITIAELSGLEMGSFTFAEASTWTRVELALIVSQGAAWCGWVAHEKIWIAAASIAAVSFPRTGDVTTEDISKASARVAFAAALQRQTVKRGILFRLAAVLALDVKEIGEAAKLALDGLDHANSIGDLPPWLALGLQAIITEARDDVGAEATS